MSFQGLDLTQSPAARPPHGVVPDFDNPASQAWMPRVAAYTTLPPMILFVSMRLYARTRITRFGLDDVLCIAGAFAIVAKVAVLFTVLDSPAGPHEWNIPVSDITVQYARSSIVLATMYYLSALFVKESLLVLYQRIFSPSRTGSILLWIGIVSTILFYVIAIGVFLGFCIPHTEDYPMGGWLSEQFTERCALVDGDMASAAGIVGTVIDLYVLVIPVCLLWGLKIPKRRKAGLSLIFLAGSAACVFSTTGTVYRLRITGGSGVNKDYSWKTMPIYALNLAEINVGIICSCMPVVYVLLRSITHWSASFVSRLRYAMPSTGDKAKDSAPSDVEMLPYQVVGDSELPLPPKGTITGLRSQIRNLGRTSRAPDNTDVLNSQAEITTTVGFADHYYSHSKHENTG